MEVPDLVLVTKGDLGAPAHRAAAEAPPCARATARTAPAAPVAIVSARTGDRDRQALELVVERARAGDDSSESGFARAAPGCGRGSSNCSGGAAQKCSGAGRADHRPVRGLLRPLERAATRFIECLKNV